MIFKAKEHCYEVNKKVMEEMGAAYQEQSDFKSRFEMSQIVYGGWR